MPVIDLENTTLEIAYVQPALATTDRNRGATLTLGTDSTCTCLSHGSPPLLISGKMTPLVEVDRKELADDVSWESGSRG